MHTRQGIVSTPAAEYGLVNLHKHFSFFTLHYSQSFSLFI
jgi:hypothetical protein